MTLGIPDLLVCDAKGKLHFIELKVTTGNVVKLSPNQVAWLTRHGHGSTWIMVRGREDLYLYQGKDAVELRSKGLQLDPYLQLKYPFDWEKLFSLTIN